MKNENFKQSWNQSNEKLFEANNYELCVITPVLLWNVKTKAVCPVQTQRVRLFIQQYHNQ